jgi:hypothetical protein
VDRAGDVLHGDRPATRPPRIHNVAARFVGAADDPASPDPAAGEDIGMDANVVLAALTGFRVGPRHTAEFNHQRVVV